MQFRDKIYETHRIAFQNRDPDDFNGPFDFYQLFDDSKSFKSIKVEIDPMNGTVQDLSEDDNEDAPPIETLEALMDGMIYSILINSMILPIDRGVWTQRDFSNYEGTGLKELFIEMINDTLDRFPDIINGLKEKGSQFITMDQAIYLGDESTDIGDLGDVDTIFEAATFIVHDMSDGENIQEWVFRLGYLRNTPGDDKYIISHGGQQFSKTEGSSFAIYGTDVPGQTDKHTVDMRLDDDDLRIIIYDDGETTSIEISQDNDGFSLEGLDDLEMNTIAKIVRFLVGLPLMMRVHS